MHSELALQKSKDRKEIRKDKSIQQVVSRLVKTVRETKNPYEEMRS